MRTNDLTWNAMRSRMDSIESTFFLSDIPITVPPISIVLDGPQASSEPGSNPEIPPPPRPEPTTPMPGDPPGVPPQPIDPPPSKPKPDTPKPVRPQSTKVVYI